MWCQLSVLRLAGNRRNIWKEACFQVGRRIRRARLAAHKLRNDPMLIVRKSQRICGVRGREACSAIQDSAKYRLGLGAGDWVRVKSQADIRATLDDDGRCEGLGYMDACMDRYCGGTYKVLKRVDKFYDERAQRMLKVKNTVLLDGVYCEAPSHAVTPWAGCQRMCFLFWKEAWLERADVPSNVDR
jgi:hypothetical protein